MDLYEFKASLGYKASTGIARTVTQRNHTPKRKRFCSVDSFVLSCQIPSSSCFRSHLSSHEEQKQLRRVILNCKCLV